MFVGNSSEFHKVTFPVLSAQCYERAQFYKSYKYSQSDETNKNKVHRWVVSYVQILVIHFGFERV